MNWSELCAAFTNASKEANDNWNKSSKHGVEPAECDGLNFWYFGSECQLPLQRYLPASFVTVDLPMIVVAASTDSKASLHITSLPCVTVGTGGANPVVVRRSSVSTSEADGLGFSPIDTPRARFIASVLHAVSRVFDAVFVLVSSDCLLLVRRGVSGEILLSQLPESAVPVPRDGGKVDTAARYDIVKSSIDNSGEITCWINFMSESCVPAMPFVAPSAAGMVISILSVSGTLGDDVIKRQLDSLVCLNRVRQHSDSPWLTTSSSNGEVEGVSCHILSFLDACKNEVVGMVYGSLPARDLSGNLFARSQNLDFVEKLWLFCLDSSSREDLVETMTAVVDALETTRLRPMVHKSNRSQFATLVRESLVGTSSRESLAMQFDGLIDPESVCTTLLEIGIDKLKRDYSTFFIAKNLITIPQFDAFFDTTSISESIFRLHIFLRVAEFWSFFKDGIPCLPFEYERKLFQCALSYWTDRMNSDIEISDVKETVLFELELGIYSPSVSSILQLFSASFAPSLCVSKYCAGGDDQVVIRGPLKIVESKNFVASDDKLDLHLGSCTQFALKAGAR